MEVDPAQLAVVPRVVFDPHTGAAIAALMTALVIVFFLAMQALAEWLGPPSR